MTGSWLMFQSPCFVYCFSCYKNVIALSHPVCLVCYCISRSQKSARHIVGAQWALGYSLGYKHTASVHRLTQNQSHKHPFPFRGPKRHTMGDVYIKSSYGNQESISMQRAQEEVTLHVRTALSKCLNGIFQGLWYCLPPPQIHLAQSLGLGSTDI